MTLVTLSTDIIWPRPINTGASGPSLGAGTLIDAAGEYHAYVLRARENMTISHVGSYIQAATGSPTMDVRIEPVDDTTGVPTGALWATNTNIVTAAMSTGWRLDALTAAASIAKDDWFSVKFLRNTGTSFNHGKASNWNDTLGASYIPYQVSNTTGSAVLAILNTCLLLALGSSATAFYQLDQAIAASAVTIRTQNNTSGGRFGLRFQVPFKCRCRGIQVAYGTTLSDIKVMMFDDAGSELASSQLLYDGNMRPTAVSPGVHHFANPVTLSPSTWYRAAIEPQTATNVTLNTYTLPSADYAETVWWGTNAHYTTYASSAWTDTATTEIPRVGLILDQLDDGASAGGGGVSRARVQLGH